MRRNFVRKGEVFIEDEAEVAIRFGGVE